MTSHTPNDQILQRDRLPEGIVRTTFAHAEVGLAGDLATLYLDGAESSALNLADPRQLEFEYMQHIRLIVDSRFTEAEPLRVLHLGGAGCALARAFDADRPNSRQLAIEIDAILARSVREWFDLPGSPRLRIRIDEARRALDTTKGTWDVVVRDAFANRHVPSQLRTLESAARAHDVLSEGGVYLLNSIASTGLSVFGEEVSALTGTFAHVMAIVDPAIMKGRRFGNIVIAASDRDFAMDTIERDVRRLPLPAKVLGESELRRRAESARPFRDADLAPGQLWSTLVPDSSGDPTV